MKRSHLWVIAMLLCSIGAHAKEAVPPTLTLDQCSWDRPGVNPFMGDLVAAVDRYRDIPPDVRERLKGRMAKREYDDLVEIRRDTMHGRGGYEYGSAIRDMHFGTHQVCRTVTRASWTPQMQERGLVYCESGHCILVPTVCRNVSRVTRRGVGPETVAGPPLLGDDPVGPALLPSPVMADAPQGPPVEWAGPVVTGPLEGGPIGHADGPAGAAGPAWWTAAALAVPAIVDGVGGGDGSTPLTLEPPRGFEGGLPPIVPPPVTTPVPEPQTWALMLAGLAAGALARRRAVKRSAAAAGSAR